MNKQKFEEKCQEFFAYEDDMYAKVLCYINRFRGQLERCGCKLESELFWTYTDENDERQISFERVNIIKHRLYACNVRLLIYSKELDCIFDEDSGETLQIIDDITSYNLNLFRGWIFRKSECNFIFDNFAKIIDFIELKGIDFVLANLDVLPKK